MNTYMRIVPTLPVNDLKRARRFYEDKFSCTLEYEGPEPSAVMRCQGNELYLYKTAPSKAEHTLAAFMVEDFDAEIEELRRKGVKFEEYDIPSMGLKTVNGIAKMGETRGAWFKDSEGNILGITEMSLKKNEDKKREAVKTR